MKANIIFLFFLIVFVAISAVDAISNDNVVLDLLLKRADEPSLSSESSKPDTESKTSSISTPTLSSSSITTPSESSSSSDSKKTASPSSSSSVVKTTSTPVEGTSSTSHTESSSKEASATSSSSISISAVVTGGISMITPAITDSETYIKIGDYATFSWNYTSLYVSPSAINVEAYCSANDYYYPIALNLSIENTEYVWNTSGYEATASVPLLTAEYTIYIYDSDSNPSAQASVGYLGVYDSLRFGVYSPQVYTPLDQYHCATCSGAFSLLDKQVLRGTLFMLLVAIGSALYIIVF
ncbi:hypothetical protein V1511DRAFT_408796 [Dipodascopsis uninucleata]